MSDPKINDRQSSLVYSTEHDVKRKQEKITPEPASKAPSAQLKVYVSLDRKRRGGKSVSVISGLSLSPGDRDGLLRKLKTRLGTGGALKDDTLEIQGDHREAICAFLEGQGYKPVRSGG
jgi:translation initiation factor 1